MYQNLNLKILFPFEMSKKKIKNISTSGLGT